MNYASENLSRTLILFVNKYGKMKAYALRFKQATIVILKSDDIILCCGNGSG